MEYVDVGTYSMRLHTVRLTELLYLPRLRQLRLVVPGLHDDVDAGAFLGANFMRQLREGCLQRLDITLLSDTEQGRLCNSGLSTAPVVACTFPWPGRSGKEPLKAVLIFGQDSSSKALGLGFYLSGHDFEQSCIMFGKTHSHPSAPCGGSIMRCLRPPPLPLMLTLVLLLACRWQAGPGAAGAGGVREGRGPLCLRLLRPGQRAARPGAPGSFRAPDRPPRRSRASLVRPGLPALILLLSFKGQLWDPPYCHASSSSSVCTADFDCTGIICEQSVACHGPDRQCYSHVVVW